MGRYVIRRVLQFIPTVLGTMFLLHYITSLGIQLTGNPVRACSATERRRPHARGAVGAPQPERPLPDPTGQPVPRPFRRAHRQHRPWDFGISLLGQREVTDIIANALPFTIRLALIAFSSRRSWGVIAGVLAGLRSGGFVDYFVKISTTLVIAVPIFVLGIVIREFVGVKFGNTLRADESIPDIISRAFAAGYKPDYPWMSLVIPGLVLGDQPRDHRPADEDEHGGERPGGLRPHGPGEGLLPRRITGVHTLRNSLHPGRHLPLGVDLGPHGRSGRHGDDLQRARYRRVQRSERPVGETPAWSSASSPSRP